MPIVNASDPADEAVRAQVRQVQVGKLAYTEENGKYEEVVKNLSQITGVQIITTPEARGIFETDNLKLNIELVASMTLENFLNHMVRQSPNLAWTVKNGVVVIGNKSQAAKLLGISRAALYEKIAVLGLDVHAA